MLQRSSGDCSGRRALGCWLVLVSALWAVGPGCSEAPQTVSEVQQSYGARFVQGMSLGSTGRVQAEGFDARSGELVSVNVDLGAQGMLHARRATIVIDPVAGTMRLRLLGVTVAPVGGTLETRDEIWTDAVRLERRVVADAGG